MKTIRTAVMPALLLFAATALWPLQPKAQSALQVLDSFYSNNLHEMRYVEIVFPEEYQPGSTEKYEALYCLEGISDFARLEYNMLKGEGFIPRLVLVGINNTYKNGVSNRDRDFTPTHVYDETGHADQFLLYLKDELLPYVQQRYPVKTTGNTLYGGSLSGLLAVYAFLKYPDLFTSYVAVDPSLWWDNAYPVTYAKNHLVNFPRLEHSLWLAGREGGAFHSMGLAEMGALLRSKAPEGLYWKRRLYDNETHFSTQFKGLWDGLKFSYGGYYASQGGYPTSREISIKPRRGLVARGLPFTLSCANLGDSPYIRYSIDGSEPTLASPSLTGESTRIRLDKASMIRFKSFPVREPDNRTDSADFEVSTEFEPVTKPGGIQPGGLRYRYYPGNWDSFPAFPALTPQRTGNTEDGFDLSSLSGQDGYALVLDGYIFIEKRGYYIFELGGSHFKVWVGGQQVLGNHIDKFGEAFMVPLKRGFYPLRIEYLHLKGGGAPTPLYMKKEQGDDFQVPSNMLFSASTR